MSSTKKLTLTALISALCVLCLGGTVLVPRLTLSMAGLAGLFPAVTVMTCGYGWAAGGSAVTVLLALLLLPDKTAGIWFACFFGHYPIWKGLIEAFQLRRAKPFLGWGMKLLGFWSCALLLYFLFGNFFAAAVSLDFSGHPAGIWLLMGILSGAFIVYDIAFSVLIGYFRTKLLPRLF